MGWIATDHYRIQSFSLPSHVMGWQNREDILLYCHYFHIIYFLLLFAAHVSHCTKWELRVTRDQICTPFNYYYVSTMDFYTHTHTMLGMITQFKNIDVIASHSSLYRSTQASLANKTYTPHSPNDVNWNSKAYRNKLCGRIQIYIALESINQHLLCYV